MDNIPFLITHLDIPKISLHRIFVRKVNKSIDISSTETDINTRLAKAWTGIDRLSVIWKSDMTDEINRSFFQAAVVSILLYGCTTWTLTKRMEKKLDGNYTKNTSSNIKQVLEVVPHKAAAVRPTYHPHEKAISISNKQEASKK